MRLVALFLQPAPYIPEEAKPVGVETPPPFLPPDEMEKFNGQPMREAIDKEKQRRALIDTAAREYETEKLEAELAGKLSPEAELFRDLELRPRISEIHNFEQKIRTPIVQGLFFRDTLAWVAGQSGTFKSFITADLAFRYGAEDMDYHGRKMTHGRTLLIIAEGAGGYADRRAAWEREHDRQVKGVDIYPAPLQLADTLREMPALLSILREAEDAGRPYGLVVFDTQAMCTVGVDENTSEMNLIVRMLHRVREVSGACVLTVHHFGKKKDSGMRGSSMVYAAADTVCVIERETSAMDVTLSTGGENGKQKDAVAEEKVLTLTLKPHAVGVDYFDEPLTSLVAIEADTSSHNTYDTPDDAHSHLPNPTEKQRVVLRTLGTFGDKGSSPSGISLKIEDEHGIKISAQLIRNRLVDLAGDDVVVQPQPKGYWFITPLGVAVIARELKDRQKVEDSWTDLASMRRGPSKIDQDGLEGV